MLTTLLHASLQATPAPGTLVTLARIADITIAVSVLVLAILGIVLFVRANRILSEIERAAHRNFGPVSDRARSISENVEYISQAVRTDVVGLHDSVQSLTARLNQASEHMEERIEDFNALMEVVQGEAEGMFLDAASAARGVRVGAHTMSNRVGAPKRQRPDDGGRGPERTPAPHEEAPRPVDAAEADEGDGDSIPAVGRGRGGASSDSDAPGA